MKRRILSLAFLFAGFGAGAQELDLGTVLRMADTANLTMRNARLDVESNQSQIKSYKSALFPKITFQGDYKYNAIIPGQVVPAEFFGGPPGSYATVQFGVPYTLSNTVQLTQVLYNPQVNYGLAALRVNTEIVDAQEQLSQQNVRYQVASMYFNLQALNKQIGFIDSNIVNMDRLIRNMQAMADQKLVVGTEVDKLRINRLSLINNREALLAAKMQIEDNLRILIGLPSAEPLRLASDSLVESTILLDQSTISRPELDLISAQQKLNVEERKGTNMSYLPSLSFYAAYNYNYNMKPESDFRKGIEGAFLGLRLDWTLFDGLEKYNKLKVNRINADKLANQQELVSQQLEAQTVNAQRMVSIQTGALGVAQEQLILAGRVYEQTDKQYRQGLIGTNDLIQVENSLQEAQTNVVASYVNLRIAELDYLKSIGNIK
jgi:outer membrane protein TolC